jgi:predicted CXXCH cytochrome family protein
VKRGIFLASLTLLLTGATLHAQIPGDVLGMHNLGPGSKSPIVGARPDACVYCHAPHSGLNMGLWNQKLTTQSYTTYTSDTETNKGRQPTLGYSTNQCLSCHDGTVAVGATVAYGQVTTSGSMYSPDVFGSNMQTSHPFSLMTPLKDSVDLVASLVANGKTADTTGAVRLIGGNVECTSCHNPHVQAKDMISQNFLVKDSSNGALCLACHDPAREMSGHVNPLANWPVSAHALSPDQISPKALLGSYPTVAADACISCHTPHNAAGPARLLRGQDEQDCIACHNGANVSSMAPYANVFPEYAKQTGHPFPSSTNPHDAAEGTLLNNNRHATCVDCHNPHGSQVVGVFPLPPLVRVSQSGAAGISASDGVSVLNPAVNQYETCLRCHGTSTGKQVLAKYGYSPVRAVSAGDPLNLIPQFSTTATSSHPVMHVRSSALSQPSLRSTMLDLLGGTTHGRAMGNQILCTDCHNSDDNREFGGSGPNGPHGSNWTHILERRYEFSQAAQPGGLITNLFPNPDLSVSGPYALCGKCHDLANQIVQNTSWNQHSSHINAGFSCSACHTAHGIGATSTAISGERLVNFDVNVVGSNNGLAISYNRTANSCVLVCHQVAHNADGTVTQASFRRGTIVRR